jgi:FkbH-like protein
MVLRREHITGYRINWRTKSENLHSLSAELRFPLDSFILLDDSPMECAEVEAGCPEVLALRLPENKAELGTFLAHMWAFDHLQVTGEDGLRNDFYARNAERVRLEKRSVSLDDFLASLELEVQISPMEKSDLARIAQLTERTNQFNFTTLRRTEPEIQQLCASGAECAVVRVRDRFGDYGLVGAMIFRAQASALELDSLLLSCRALGRRVEHRMLAYLGQMAMTRLKKQVRIRFVPTPKNQPAREFLDGIGAVFAPEGKSDFLSWHAVPKKLAGLGQGEA